MSFRIDRVTVIAALLVAGLAPLAAVAQGPQRPQQPATPPRVLTAPQKQANEIAPAQPAQNSGDSEFVRRVEQLEEQFVDLQIIVGTLDSLARTGGGPPSSPAGVGGRSAGVGMPGEDAGRIGALEDSGAGADRPDRAALRPDSAMSGGGPAVAAARPGGFGATTVTPGGGDPIGEILSTEPQGDAAEFDAARCSGRRQSQAGL